MDGVLCRFGYMLMPDPAAALAETRRVLRPGGRVALAVWGPPERNPWLTILSQMLVEGGTSRRPIPGPRRRSPLGDGDRLRVLLRARATAMRVAEMTVWHRYQDVDAYLVHSADTAGRVALVLRGLSGPEWERLATGLERAFAPFAGEEGYALPGVALVAVASAPGPAPA